ncbi:MAG: hypothetical protein QY306_15130 [Anaerolineales bacterium]|nr:MAG: hypothetical protein QY306_15130 [Anaerolineales bacterium]
MNNIPALKWLVPAIMALTLIAVLMGLLPGEGQPYPLTNFRGEEVIINARGLYYWDTLSSAAQMQANDLVTLVLGLPLLSVSLWMTSRGSLRGRLLLTGTLGFILYTYITMCFGAAYNKIFLIYVALFSLSLFAFILSMMSFDLETLPARFSERLPRGWIAGLLFFAAAFLSLAWLGRIAATFTSGAIPALENVTSMFIQAMDLGVIVPLCILSGILLLRQSAWGYLLASVSLLKFLTMGAAVSLMSFNMARVGAPISAVELTIFPSITLANLVMAALLFRSIAE